MPHSLRAKIKGLRYKGIITDKECDRICKALDNEGVLGKIRAEIEGRKEGEYLCFDDDDMYIYTIGLNDAIGIIDKYKTEPKDIEMQATEFLAEARACAER